jgi:ubiquinone/menaquinone biosynthesis C-methylase UbiE
MMKHSNSIKANIELHTKLADVYRLEPHYRPENVERVGGILRSIQQAQNAASLLDIGCGQGFIIDIAKNFFRTIRGIDITQAMLDKIDITSKMKCDIKVSIANAENLPFENEQFDVCTAYAVLHHLSDVKTVAKEVFRTLKQGGTFFSSLDPNYYYWQCLKNLSKDTVCGEVLQRELTNTLEKDKEVSEEYGIPIEVIDKAEAFKHLDGGFKEENLLSWFQEVGFSSVRIEYDWFMGQGKYIHDANLSTHLDAIVNFLKDAWPASRPLYKYVSIFATK